MKTFEELENIWNEQAEIKPQLTAEQSRQKMRAQTRMVKTKHIATIAVLTFWSGLLIFYFSSISSYPYKSMLIGPFIMLSMLLVRILFEWKSFLELRKVTPGISSLNYCRQVHRFFLWRKKILYIITPVTYLGYIIGFYMLHPIFKRTLSHEFYIYVLLSAIPIFIIFWFYILGHIKKEMKILHYLNQLVKDINNSD